jgi:hypothetical protein
MCSGKNNFGEPRGPDIDIAWFEYTIKMLPGTNEWAWQWRTRIGLRKHNGDILRPNATLCGGHLPAFGEVVQKIGRLRRWLRRWRVNSCCSSLFQLDQKNSGFNTRRYPTPYLGWEYNLSMHPAQFDCWRTGFYRGRCGLYCHVSSSRLQEPAPVSTTLEIISIAFVCLRRQWRGSRRRLWIWVCQLNRRRHQKLRFKRFSRHALGRIRPRENTLTIDVSFYKKMSGSQ